MEKLTDQQNMIDEIAKLMCNFPKCLNYNKVGGCINDRCPTVDKAENVIKQGYIKQEWISVEDRLPEDKQLCLIFTTIYFTPDHIGDCDHYDGMEISSFYTDMGFVSNNGFYAEYWMPLPTPPKMKGAE